MEAQAEDLDQRVQAARAARLQSQMARRLAAERVEKLERKLKDAAESGLRSEISRGIEMRGHLRTASRRNLAARYTAIAAFALLLGVAALGLGWVPLQDAAATGQSQSQVPVLIAPPGDRLELSLSYSVSLPAAP